MLFWPNDPDLGTVTVYASKLMAYQLQNAPFSWVSEVRSFAFAGDNAAYALYRWNGRLQVKIFRDRSHLRW
jgi:hypothetical protein